MSRTLRASAETLSTPAGSVGSRTLLDLFRGGLGSLKSGREIAVRAFVVTLQIAMSCRVETLRFQWNAALGAAFRRVVDGNLSTAIGKNPDCL